MKTVKKITSLALVVLLCLVMLPTFGVGNAATLVGEELNIKCRDFSLTTMEGDTLTRDDLKGKTTVMVFFRTNCGNSLATLTDIGLSQWVEQEDIAVIAVNLAAATSEEWEYFQTAVDCDRITYCEREGDNALLWYLLSDVGYSEGSVSLPVTFFMDENGYIQYAVQGKVSEEELLSYLYRTGADVTLPPPPVELKVTGTFDYDMAYEVLDIINETRAEQGLHALYMDEVMLDYAMQRAAECAVYYGHTRPTGKDCFSIVGYTSYYNAENVAAGQKTAEEVMKDFIESPGHYANIISETATNVGVGCFYQDGYVFWAQFFGNREGTEVTLSGKKTATATIPAKEDYLDLYLYGEEEIDEIGQSVQLRVTGTNLGFTYSGYEVDPFSFLWSSSDPAVAVVEDGLVTAKAPGKTTVTLTLGELSITKDITVTATVVPGLSGDVDLSGEITAADLTKLARHVAGIEILADGQGMVNADVDGVAGISAGDLTKLARFLAHIDVL